MNKIYGVNPILENHLWNQKLKMKVGVKTAQGRLGPPTDKKLRFYRSQFLRHLVDGPSYRPQNFPARLTTSHSWSTSISKTVLKPACPKLAIPAPEHFQIHSKPTTNNVKILQTHSNT